MVLIHDNSLHLLQKKSGANVRCAKFHHKKNHTCSLIMSPFLFPNINFMSFDIFFSSVVFFRGATYTLLLAVTFLFCCLLLLVLLLLSVICAFKDTLFMLSPAVKVICCQKGQQSKVPMTDIGHSYIFLREQIYCHRRNLIFFFCDIVKAAQMWNEMELFFFFGV